MFKLSKGTHFTILATFAVVFVTIYLYYTITDVRRLQARVSGIEKEISALQNDLGSLACVGGSGGSCPMPTPSHTPTPAEVFNMMPVAGVADDDDSVSSEEIQKMLNAADAEAETVVNVVPVVAEDDVSPEVPEPITPAPVPVTEEPIVVTTKAAPSAAKKRGGAKKVSA